MKKEPIILIGGGGHCKSCIDVIEQNSTFEIIGIVDIKDNVGDVVLGYPLIGTDDDLLAIFSDCRNALITIGQIKTHKPRRALYEKLNEIGYRFPSIVSPLSYVSQHAVIGEGTIVMHHALVNANAVIGKNCIINTKVLIEHDACVGDFCHISTAGVVNGGVNIKKGTFYGSNSTSKEYATSNEDDFIKAQSIFKGRE